MCKSLFRPVGVFCTHLEREGKLDVTISNLGLSVHFLAALLLAPVYEEEHVVIHVAELFEAVSDSSSIRTV